MCRTQFNNRLTCGGKQLDAYHTGLVCTALTCPFGRCPLAKAARVTQNQARSEPHADSQQESQGAKEGTFLLVSSLRAIQGSGPGRLRPAGLPRPAGRIRTGARFACCCTLLLYSSRILGSEFRI